MINDTPQDRNSSSTPRQNTEPLLDIYAVPAFPDMPLHDVASNPGELAEPRTHPDGLEIDEIVEPQTYPDGLEVDEEADPPEPQTHPDGLEIDELSEDHRLAVMLREHEQYEAALSVFQRALQEDTKNAHLYNSQGVTYYQMQQYHEALLAFERAITLYPDNALFQSNRGYALLKNGLLSEAIEAFERAISCDENCSTAYYGMGSVYEQSQRYGRARNVVFMRAAI